MPTLRADELPLLMAHLARFLPETLPMYSTADNVLRGRVSLQEVCFVVDTWPLPSAVLLLSPRGVGQLCNYRSTVDVWAIEADCVEHLLAEAGLNWSEPIFFRVLGRTGLQQVQNAARKRSDTVDCVERLIYVLTSAVPQLTEPPDGMMLHSASQQDAETVGLQYSAWGVQPADTVPYFQACLQRLPSSALYTRTPTAPLSQGVTCSDGHAKEVTCVDVDQPSCPTQPRQLRPADDSQAGEVPQSGHTGTQPTELRPVGDRQADSALQSGLTLTQPKELSPDNLLLSGTTWTQPRDLSPESDCQMGNVLQSGTTGTQPRESGPVGDSQAGDVSQSCLIQAQDGKLSGFTDTHRHLISYVVLHHTSAFGSVATAPEYQRQGLGGLVVRDICQKLLEDGQMPYVFVNPDNTASARLYQKCGMVPGAEACRIRYIPSPKNKEF